MRRELPRPVSRDRSFSNEPQSMGPKIRSEPGTCFRSLSLEVPQSLIPKILKTRKSQLCLSYVLSNVSNMLKKDPCGKFPERPLLRRDWKHGANFCSWSSVQSRQLSEMTAPVGSRWPGQYGLHPKGFRKSALCLAPPGCRKTRSRDRGESIITWYHAPVLSSDKIK